jgi:glycosyltransferase involved in cell wall biosynthesis
MQKITAIIPCYNEEDNIKAVLESVKWADEIMVVDSFSTDNTLQIARAYTDFIIQRDYENSASQKNWAIPQATHDWILLVDADERISPLLKTEIQQLLSEDKLLDAYWIDRQNYFMGKPLKHMVKNDKVIRLFKKTCRYQPVHVHSEIITDQIQVGKLKGLLHHHTFKNIDTYMEKINRYAAWSAKDYAKKTKSVTFYHLLVKPAFRFFKHYILERGFMDGKVGFVMSCVLSWAVFMRYWKMMEIHQERQ